MEAYVLVDIEKHKIKKTYFTNRRNAVNRVIYLNKKYSTNYRIITLKHDDFDKCIPEVDLYDWEHNL